MLLIRLLKFISPILLLCWPALEVAYASAPYSEISFTENKGQISDQYLKPRTDILFGGNDGKLAFFLKPNGVSYQQYRVEEWLEAPDFDNKRLPKSPGLSTIYRIDINWLNSNPNPLIEKLFPADGVSNFYGEAFPEGVLGVKSFKQLIYKNLYKGINLKWYSKDGKLKYDFVVNPGADYQQIKMEVKGALRILINEKQELEIITPLGSIIEQAPVVYQGNKNLKASWKMEGNQISFVIAGIDKTLPLVIDPGVRLWGSYYGGNNTESALASCSDPAGNVYFGGTTNSSGGTGIATVGSHQALYGGGADNAYIAKFNSAGVRLWGTYYGGNIREFGLYVAADANGNCALAGYSFGSPPNVISTPGSHQVAYGGGFTDAFVVKFNTNGVRQWGTFYGGPGHDTGLGVTFDQAGNLYLCGKTDAATPGIIATGGVHQSSFGGVEDAFLVKFNLTGTRIWGTYLGGIGTDEGKALCTDKYGNIYMTGSTDNSTPNAIATPGAHQNTFGGGGYDAYVVKFNSNGIRLWGTQYGGNGTDRGYGVAVDDSLNIYMSGKTASTNSMTTLVSHQPFYGGGPNDAFLVKFDSTGVRKWGTYYGGTGDDDGWGCALHKTGHVYIAGSTTSQTGTVIATPGSHQANFGGGTWDAFIAQFDWNGNRMWGSYYGETGDDISYGCSTDNAYHVYLNGATDTNSGTSIATSNGHQPIYNGGFGEAYIAKFYDCPAPPAPTSTTSPSSLNYCAGSASTLHALGTGTLNWYASLSSTTSIGTGSTFVTPVLNAGMHTYYVDAATCTVSPKTAITITVNPTPTLNALANPTAVCAGKSTTIVASGALTYTWSSGSNSALAVVSPSATSVYTVVGTNTFGCVGERTIQINVHPLDPVFLTPSTYTSCLTIFGGGPVTLTGTPPGGSYSGPNVSGNVLNPTALGVFTPVYTYTNPITGCSNSATTSIQVISCMGLNEQFISGKNILSVSPNPGNGIFTILFTNDKQKEIKIYDAAGKMIVYTSTKSKETKLNITEKPAGLYFVEVKSEVGFERIKIVNQ